MSISIKKATAKGKKYAYIRGTNVALVRGFVGTEHQFDAALATAIKDFGRLPLKSVPDISAVGESRSVMDRLRLSAAKAMHRRCSARSREFKRAYLLSVETIHQMLIDAGDGCTLTGIPFDYRNSTNHRVHPMAPSPDRIDNRLGYESGNVRLVLACVNIALNEWGLDNFKRVCRAILENETPKSGKRNERDPVICRDILYLGS